MLGQGRRLADPLPVVRLQQCAMLLASVGLTSVWVKWLVGHRVVRVVHRTARVLADPKFMFL